MKALHISLSYLSAHKPPKALGYQSNHARVSMNSWLDAETKVHNKLRRFLVSVTWDIDDINVFVHKITKINKDK